MKRYELINLLIKYNGYKTYLEIGVEEGECFKMINCMYKDSVDPCVENEFETLNWYPVNYKMTSDMFFKHVSTDKKYDIIFIDGLHEYEQVNKDIANSLDHLNADGVIIVHDCNPKSYDMQKVPREQVYWSGDVWKSIVNFANVPYLKVFVIDEDTGLGVITVEKNDNVKSLPGTITWDYFDVNRETLLNLKSSNDFLINFLKERT